MVLHCHITTYNFALCHTVKYISPRGRYTRDNNESFLLLQLSWVRNDTPPGLDPAQNVCNIKFTLEKT